jgi:hypothetical protein
MAQKKLLLVLAALIPMFLMANSNAEAGEGLLAEKVTEADRDRLKGLIEESREIVMSTKNTESCLCYGSSGME